MRSRTSPPPAPRRRHWLVLGLSAGVASCATWLDVPDEPAIRKDSPPPSTVMPSAPPPWRPPLAGSRYSGPPDAQPPDHRPPAGNPPHSTSPGGPPLMPPGSDKPDAGATVTPPPPVDEPVVEPPVFEPPAPDDMDAGAPPPACAGAELFGICWYIGKEGQSCEQTCADHGGPDGAASEHVGTAYQGGSREDCVLILNALGQPYRVRTTEHDQGVGCHVPAGDEYQHWLSYPPFNPRAKLPTARIACGCKH